MKLINEYNQEVKTYGYSRFKAIKQWIKRVMNKKFITIKPLISLKGLDTNEEEN